jgi:hypothetical protein
MTMTRIREVGSPSWAGQADRGYETLGITAGAPGERPVRDIRRRLAVLLLAAAADESSRPHLSRRVISEVLGVPWRVVDLAIQALRAEGAIKIDHHRMIIDKQAAERIALSPAW